MYRKPSIVYSKHVIPQYLLCRTTAEEREEGKGQTAKKNIASVHLHLSSSLGANVLNHMVYGCLCRQFRNGGSRI